MSTVDKEAATIPPPPVVPNPQTELILAELRKMRADFETANANMRLVANVVKEHGTAIEEIDRKVTSILQQVEGAREASSSAIDIATEAKAVIRDSIPPERTLRAICENAEEEAAIAMDVATQIAEQFGVRGIVDRVREEHAESRSERSRASVGTAR